MRYIVRVMLVLSIGAGPMSLPAFAQARGRATISLAAAQSRPLGALGRNLGVGYGITGALTIPLERSGRLSIRAELGEMEYGRESQRTAFSETVGGRVEVMVRTTNAVVPISLGIQGELPFGPLAVYAHGGVAAQVFYTATRIEPTAGGYSLVSSINQSDITFGWNLGSGVSVPLHSSARQVRLDLGVQYIAGGRASYLVPGSIVDHPDGRITVTPLESRAPMLAIRAGIRIGL